MQNGFTLMIVSVFVNRKDQGMESVNITIGPLDFDHADYDAEGDVPCSTCTSASPRRARGRRRPEGHVLRYAPGTSRVVGLTVLGAQSILERDGHLAITIPETIETTAEDLAPALAAA